MSNMQNSLIFDNSRFALVTKRLLPLTNEAARLSAVHERGFRPTCEVKARTFDPRTTFLSTGDFPFSVNSKNTVINHINYYKSNLKEVNKMHTKWEEAQHEDRVNFVSVMLERFSLEEIANKMNWDDDYVKAIKSEIDSKKR